MSTKPARPKTKPETNYNTCPACKKPVPLFYRLLGARYGPFKCPNCGTRIRESFASMWRILLPILALVTLVLVAAMILRLVLLAIIGVLVFIVLQIAWRRSYSVFVRSD